MDFRPLRLELRKAKLAELLRRLSGGIELSEYIEADGATVFPASPQGGLPPAFSLSWIGGVMELVGGLFILAGLFTRPVAFLLAGETAVAYWMFHAPRSFLPAAQWRRCGDPLLLRVPAPRIHWSWRLEP